MPSTRNSLFRSRLEPKGLSFPSVARAPRLFCPILCRGERFSKGAHSASGPSKRWGHRHLVGALAPWVFATCLVACSPAIRGVGKTGSSDATSQARDPDEVGPEDDRQKNPPPPSPGRIPPLAAVTRKQLEEGPHVCITPRPDFPRTYVELQLSSPQRPEMVALLRGWLLSAWGAELGDVAFDPSASACQGAFICAAFAHEDAQSAVSALLRALDKHPPTAFFSGRMDVLETSEERDRSDPNWKLHSAAAGLSSPNAQLLALTRADAPPDASTVEKVLSRDSGASLIKRTGIADLTKILLDQLPSMRILVASSSSSTKIVEAAEDAWPTPRQPSPVRSRPAATKNESALVHVHLSESAGEWSHGLVLISPAKEKHLEEIEMALFVIADRVTTRGGSARVWVHSPETDYTLPALRVDGPHEEVDRALLAIAEESVRLTSASGAPTLEEWARAELGRAQVRARPWSRCGSDPEAAALTSEEVRAALRSAENPISVIWGVPAGQDESEQAE